jgi:acetolactate decarboxylase
MCILLVQRHRAPEEHLVGKLNCSEARIQMTFCRGIVAVGIASILYAGCAASTDSQPPQVSAAPMKVVLDDALVQFSLIAALADGDYSDGVPLGDVLAGGDFGVGTFNRLDGEMIVLDGRIYQALSDGTTRASDTEDTTPFAAVTFFDEDGRIEHLSTATLEDLDKQLDRKLPRRNSPYAIRIDGQFTELTLRSVPAQKLPFLPLVEVVKQQRTWQHRNASGTLVGLRCPSWVGTLNVAGYHWHFLSDDRKIGGHVLACEFKEALLRFDECTSIVIHVPQTSEFDSFDAAKIKQQDIHQIERQRTSTESRKR